MRIAVVTLFPDMFDAVRDFGVTSRAMNAGLVELTCWNPRDFSTDRHRTVDDRPFGGGPGMLMKTEPLQAAIAAAREGLLNGAGDTGQQQIMRPRVIYLSPQGRRLDQAGLVELAGCEKLVMVCGRYQGIDQRLLDAEIDQEWSLGDFVISGGELAAMVVIDAVTRLQPGALGTDESAALDSFANGLLHCPQYTRPQQVAGETVPEVLLSGDHDMIRRWRLKQSLGTTWRKRPDLLANLQLDAGQRALLDEYIDEFQTFPAATARRSKIQE